MKKTLPTIIILLSLITMFFLLILSKTYANRGCCSNHGGQSYCDKDGRIVCNDGTYSPSCICDQNEVLNKNDNVNNSGTNLREKYNISNNYNITTNEPANNNENNNDNDMIGIIAMVTFFYGTYKLLKLKKH